MQILSIGPVTLATSLSMTIVEESQLHTVEKFEMYDYIIIHGGDGTIRRVMKQLIECSSLPPFIIHPTGSFNVIAKLHRVPPLDNILKKLEAGRVLQTASQSIYRMNKEVFLFSAGNMGDLQHIFLAETLRFGWLKKGIFKYLLASLFLFPLHLLMTPFMLLSARRFFIFTPFSVVKKFGTFYGQVPTTTIDLQNQYNLIELDGDIVTIKESLLHIDEVKTIKIVIT